MIPWWGWMLILIFSIGIGIASVPLLLKLFIEVMIFGRHLSYAREAKAHNNRARLLRLQKAEWYGFPLPTGKKGSLTITREQLIANPNRISVNHMTRAYLDRGLDLKVDLCIVEDRMSNSFVVKWLPHKGRWPKEKY